MSSQDLALTVHGEVPTAWFQRWLDRRGDKSYWFVKQEQPGGWMLL